MNPVTKKCQASIIHLDKSEICDTVQVDKERRNECKVNPNWGNQNYPLAEGKYHHIIKYHYQNRYILLIHLAYDILSTR